MTIYTHLFLKNKMHTYPAEVHFLSFNIAQVTVLILPGVEIPVVSIIKFLKLKISINQISFIFQVMLQSFFYQY